MTEDAVNRNSPSHKRPFLRIALVLVLSLYSMTTVIPTLWEPWHPRGDFGLSVDDYGLVNAIKPHSAAADAGLVVGDVVDVAHTNLRERQLIGSFPFPGTRLSLTATRSGKPINFTFSARPMHWSFGEKTGFVLGVICSVIIVVIGAVLALVRPGLMTFAFFLYCVQFTPGELAIFYDLLSPLGKVAQVFWGITTGAAGYCGLLAFALLFPSERVSGWRKSMYLAVPLIFFIDISLNSYNFISGMLFNRDPWPSSAAINSAVFFLHAAIYVAALIAFLYTFSHARGDTRQRIKWIIAGFTVAVAVFIIADATPWLYVFAPDWMYAFIYLPAIAAPLAVAYAVIRHRVIDVNFVINRTLLYTCLIGMFVGILVLVDALMTKLLTATRIEIAVDIGIAAVMGYLFSKIQQRLILFVDRFFLRASPKAHNRLKLIRDSLRDMTTTGEFNILITERVATALGLDSAAIFHADASGGYVREAAVGWPAGMTWHLFPSDPLVRKLSTRNKGVRIANELEGDFLPKGTARPGIALPFFKQNRIGAVALYGAHSSGSDLDPEEMRELSNLAGEASLEWGLLAANS